MESAQLNLFCEFLTDSSRDDVKIVALHELLGLTGNKETCLQIENTNIPELLLECLFDKNEIVCKSACLSLVNISACESSTLKMMTTTRIIARLMSQIIDPNSGIADAVCMLLSNLTRQSDAAMTVINYMLSASIDVEKLINIFINLKYNTRGCNLHYMASLFSNLSQVSEFRMELMNKTKCLIQKLFPFTQFETSSVRRNGIVGTLRNCCFDTDYHEWLLGSDVDILPHLLLPLAGPEEFSEEDNDKLPLDLQYLGEDKKREPDGEIRKMLLEAIHQLCATKFGREFLRNKNTYVILREYHKWEEKRNILLACENVVDILIRTEEEINEENLKNLDVPESYISKFEEMDNNYLQE